MRRAYSGSILVGGSMLRECIIFALHLQWPSGGSSVIHISIKPEKAMDIIIVNVRNKTINIVLKRLH